MWLRAANDVAMYFPMMEMCHKRLSYMPEISYMYNSNTGLNNHKVKAKEQKSNERMIKTRNSYKALENLFTEEELQKLKESKNSFNILWNKIKTFPNKIRQTFQYLL